MKVLLDGTRQLDGSKASGPDGIHPRIMKPLVGIFVIPFTQHFDASMEVERHLGDVFGLQSSQCMKADAEIPAVATDRRV